MGYLKTSLVLFFMFIAVLAANIMDARADYGASIMRTNCDPKASLVDDNSKTEKDEATGYYPLKSCVGQKIRYDEFKVKIFFEPNAKFISLYEAANFAIILQFFPYVYSLAYSSAYSSCTTSSYMSVVGATAASYLCVLPAKAAGDAALVANATVMLGSLYIASLATDGKDARINWVAVGETKNLLTGGIIPGIPVAAASVYIVGDKACVMISARPVPFLTFPANRTDDFNTKYNIDPVNAENQKKCEDAETSGGYEPGSICFAQNCVAMPPPPSLVKPPVPTFISTACVDYDNTASQFVWPLDSQVNKIHGRSFIGVVVQCVEESMTNLFFNAHMDVGVATGAPKSVFVKLQEKLQSYILAMLCLYIVILGYKYGILDRGGIKNQDFIFAVVKIGCVMFFASGVGMTQLAPGIIGSVKELSAIVLDAAIGVTGDKTATIAKKNLANANYVIASNDYNIKRNIWWSHMNEDDADHHVSDMKAQMDAAKVLMDNANNELQKAKTLMLSFGYDYCNFKPFVEAGKYKVSTKLLEDTTIPYDTKDGNGNILTAGTVLPKNSTVVRDMRAMYLWDSIDCRISRYLGVGLNGNSREAPQFLLVAIGMLGEFWNPIGWIIFALSIVFLIFVILIVIRVVQIYIISFVAIVLLIYISPLIFPLMLFDYTKSSFDRWFKQMLSYMLQPVILFGFLAFMFAVFDNIIWGNNDAFYPSIKSQLYDAPKVSDNSIQRINKISGTTAGCLNPPNKVDGDYVVKRAAFLDNCRCPDESAIGCMLERYDITNKPIIVGKAVLATVYEVTNTLQNVSTDTVTNPEGLSQDSSDCNSDATKATSPDCTSKLSHSSSISESDKISYMLGMLKVLFACFIVHALLGQIEAIATTLTNSAAPASKMATVPAATPHKIAATTGNAVYKGGEMAGKSVKRVAIAAGNRVFGEGEKGGGKTGESAGGATPPKTPNAKKPEPASNTQNDANAADPDANRE